MPVDKDVARVGLELFDEAMDLAETGEVKVRVEKASICAYAAVLDPIWRIEEDEVFRFNTNGKCRLKGGENEDF